MTMILMEATILVPIALVGISTHFLQPLQGRIILDLHKDLLKWDVQRGILLVSCWRARLLSVSVFPVFRSSFLWTRALLRVATGIYVYSLRPLPLLSDDQVFCIHKILSRMDKFSHGLGLFFIEFVYEQIWIHPIMEGHQQELIICFVHTQGFSIETGDERP